MGDAALTCGLYSRYNIWLVSQVRWNTIRKWLELLLLLFFFKQILPQVYL